VTNLLSGWSVGMPKNFYLTFTAHETGTTETVSVKIPDNEWHTLLDFARYADQLELTEFVRAGIDDHCEITGDEITEESRALFVDILGAKVEAILEVRDLVRWLEDGCKVNVEPREFRSRGAI
jgi:hypothetical protein